VTFLTFFYRQKLKKKAKSSFAGNVGLRPVFTFAEQEEKNFIKFWLRTFAFGEY